MNKEKWEQRAKYWDDKLPNLAKALRSQDVQKTCADIQELDGWIRVTTSKPHADKYVLITNGEDVWIGDYSNGQWGVVYDGAPPFNSTEIIAWMFMPSIPPELKKHLS